MRYRLELHETETRKWYAQIHDRDKENSDPLWESRVYDELEDAYSFAKYEIDRRKNGGI